MIKVTNLVEQIFATAVALEQSGNMKNTIYAVHDSIFILNYDHTVLIRFKLRKSEAVFENPVSFKANDYDSDQFEQVGNKIIFHSSSANFERKKICGSTDLTPEEVEALFTQYVDEDEDEREVVQIPMDVLGLLDDSLSHIEFSGEEGKPLLMVQRNIYSGGLIEIRPKKSGMLSNTVENSFEVLGMKTQDFRALFSFQDVLNFAFPITEGNYTIVTGIDRNKRDMTAVVSKCLYDEIIELQTVKKSENGRKKQKVRGRV